jgi:hypothetical protein
MKPAKILLMLAALAGSAVHATPVTASFSATSGPSNSITSNTGGVVATGYVVLGGGSWMGPSNIQVAQTTNGVGVSSFGSQTGSLVEGTFSEHLLLDFGSTLTGAVQISSIELYFPNTPASPFFTYQWLSAVPSGTTPTYPLAQSVSSGISTGLNNFTGISGSGRYLFLGGVPLSNSTANYFSVKSVTYTSVPDGASTLALMGAAVATLGFAARRRRA